MMVALDAAYGQVLLWRRDVELKSDPDMPLRQQWRITGDRRSALRTLSAEARAARSPALGSDVVALGYGALGLTADGGNTLFLPRMVGMRRAQELFLLGVFRAAGDNDRVLFGVEEHAANGAEGAGRTVG